MALSTRGSEGPRNRIAGAILGLLAGSGVGVALVEASVLDPRNLVGLALPVGGVIVGFAIAGALRPRS